MTRKTIEALRAFVSSVKDECDRGHIPDELGNVGATASVLLESLNAEPSLGSEEFLYGVGQGKAGSNGN